MTIHRAELCGWLRLTLTPGVGNETARRLLAAFGLPQVVFDQSTSALRQLTSPAQAAALARTPDGLEQLLDATWDWLHEPAIDSAPGPCKQIVTLGDALYPPALLSIDDPPLLLYFLGDRRLAADGTTGEAGAVQLLARTFANSIAIVGSRNPTPQGAVNAREFARALGRAGLTIVSGMALGIDGAAHEGALEACDDSSDSLATVAVVGTGLDRVYPKKHLELARRIAQRGLIVSEYPIGTPPLEANFPKRNRLIAALSRGTLVVEAALRSGSLITARLAVEQGKEVFAIPGSIHSTQSRGCHALIKQGAKLVESAQDVLEELNWRAHAGTVTSAAPGRSPASSLRSAQHESTPANAIDDRHDALPDTSSGTSEDSLLAALGFDPVGLDALQARTGIDTARLQARLMALELEGRVARLPGGLFQRQEVA